MRSRYKIVDEDNYYFISSSIVNWIPVFTSAKYFNILVDSMKFCQKNRSLKIYNYVIMDNHFHMIVKSEHLSSVISSLKRFTALELVKAAQKDEKYWLLKQFWSSKKSYKSESDHQIWQEGFHPQLISSEDMLYQKIDYIHFNPVKRGFVNQPEYWRYSSACNKDGENNLIIKLDDINEL
jgi:putative transposase